MYFALIWIGLLQSVSGTVGITVRGRGIVGRGVHGGIVGRGGVGGRCIGTRGTVRGRVGMMLQGTCPVYIYLVF